MSSLRLALNSATSSLSVTQAKMAVTASNIANADTEGYSKKVATTSSVTVSGWGSGVTVTGVSSTADANLLRQLNVAEGALGEAQSVSEYRQAISDLMGSLESDGTGTSLASQITTLTSALSSLAETPESTTLGNQVLAAVDDLASSLRDLSSEVQSLRKSADSDIADAVDTINTQLQTIDDLNDQIVRLQSLGEPTGDLEDQRMEALSQISALMDVSYFVSSNGEMKIYTTGGTTLLDGTVRTLEFDESGSVNSDTTYPDTLSGITVGGKDITSDISSGALDGLFAVRDTELTAVQDELDSLASTLITTVNSITNQGSAVPAPTTLTGTESFSGTDSFSATGTWRIAVTDSSGALVSYTDLDLSAYGSIQDLVSAVDGISGVSASLNSDGQLVVSSEDESYGVSTNPMDSVVTSPETTPSEGSITSLFGLNSLLTGTSASDIFVSETMRDDPALLPMATLSSDETLTIGSTVLASGDGSIAEALFDALNSDQSFDATGTLGSKTCSLAEYAAAIVSEASSRNETASSALASAETRQSTLADSVASASGVNVDEETAELESLQTAYSAAAKLLEVINSMFEDLMNAVN